MSFLGSLVAFRGQKLKPELTAKMHSTTQQRMETKAKKRSLLGFDNSSSSEDETVEVTRQSKVRKMHFKPIDRIEGQLTDELEAEEDKNTSQRLRAYDDYLDMPIIDNETTMSHSLNNEEHGHQPMLFKKDDTMSRLKTSLFGQIVDDKDTTPVIQPLRIKSKGLTIMERMGFKIGEVLGKEPMKEDALLEPIMVIPRKNKGGIGGRTVGKQHQDEDIKADGITHEDEQEFKARLQMETSDQRKERIVRKMQRLCFELTDGDVDVEKALLEDLNVMWRGYVGDIQESLRKKRGSIAAVDDERVVEVCAEDDNEKQRDESEDEELEMFKEEPVDIRLRRLYLHLRSQFDYCFWCGARYEDQTDLHANCPGESEEDHL